jgi:hypothetical protein
MMIVPYSLPTGFADTRNHATIGKITETDTTDTELAVDRAGTTAEFAASFLTNWVLWFSIRFGDLRFSCHKTTCKKF